MARALNALFYTQGIKSFLLFFVRWKWTYIDMFMTLMFIPICVLMCIWLPVYYIYVLVYHGLREFKYGIPQFDAGSGLTMFWKYFNTICYALAFAFVAAFILQALLAMVLERKRLKTSAGKMLPAALLFPAFMVIYAAAVTIGVFKKPKWSQVKRNASKVDVAAVDTDVGGSPR